MINGCNNAFFSSLFKSFLLASADELRLASCLVPSTTPTPLPDLFDDPMLEVVPLTVLAAFGVGVVVQYHLPSAKAQARPSLASVYGSVWLISLPAGSRSQTCPPLLDRLILMFSDGYAA